MDKNELLKSLRARMEKSMGVLSHEFKGLRTGRASAGFLDPVMVEAYGSKMPLSQVGTVSTPDARTIAVQVWDNSMMKAVEKAIVEANLGLNPAADGQMVRMAVPPLSEERRKDLVKLAHKYAEQVKVSIRNVRRDGMDEIKGAEKSGAISEDESKGFSNDVQKLTDEFIKKIDEESTSKEKDILTV